MNTVISKAGMLILGLSVLFMVTSCKSSKEMTALKAEKESVQSQLSACTTEKAQLMADLTKSKKETADAVQKAEMEKRELESFRKIIEAENKKIQKMKKELEAAFSGFDKKQVRIDERDGRLIVVMQNQILYQPGKVALDTKGTEAIQTIPQVFKNNKGLNILVESHTDNMPINNKNYKDNWDLSVARSVAVVRLLEKYGVNPTRMTAAGRGEFVPVSDIGALNEKTRAQNRRTEFVISPKIQGLYKMLGEL